MGSPIAQLVQQQPLHRIAKRVFFFKDVAPNLFLLVAIRRR